MSDRTSSGWKRPEGYSNQYGPWGPPKPIVTEPQWRERLKLHEDERQDYLQHIGKLGRPRKPDKGQDVINANKGTRIDWQGKEVTLKGRKSKSTTAGLKPATVALDQGTKRKKVQSSNRPEDVDMDLDQGADDSMDGFLVDDDDEDIDMDLDQGPMEDEEIDDGIEGVLDDGEDEDNEIDRDYAGRKPSKIIQSTTIAGNRPKRQRTDLYNPAQLSGAVYNTEEFMIGYRLPDFDGGEEDDEDYGQGVMATSGSGGTSMVAEGNSEGGTDEDDDSQIGESNTDLLPKQGTAEPRTIVKAGSGARHGFMDDKEKNMEGEVDCSEEEEAPPTKANKTAHRVTGQRPGTGPCTRGRQPQIQKLFDSNPTLSKSPSETPRAKASPTVKVTKKVRQ